MDRYDENKHVDTSDSQDVHDTHEVHGTEDVHDADDVRGTDVQTDDIPHPGRKTPEDRSASSDQESGRTRTAGGPGEA
jgi:hypothetical protein